MNSFEVSQDLRVELLKAFIDTAWAEATMPQTAGMVRAELSEDQDAIDFEAVKERLGDQAAAVWQRAIADRQEFFLAAETYAAGGPQIEAPEVALHLTVKELRWADKQPGSLGMCRAQADGQMEVYTLCGRYVIRSRNSSQGHRWVTRYLGHLPISVRENMADARIDAQKDHDSRIRSEIDFGGRGA